MISNKKRTSSNGEGGRVPWSPLSSPLRSADLARIFGVEFYSLILLSKILAQTKLARIYRLFENLTQASLNTTFDPFENARPLITSQLATKTRSDTFNSFLQRWRRLRFSRAIFSLGFVCCYVNSTTDEYFNLLNQFRLHTRLGFIVRNLSSFVRNGTM